MNPKFWSDRTVFLTGHTGFKGGWMALWLSHLGAKVHGYSLQPSTVPNFFSVLNLEDRLEKSLIADIRDIKTLSNSIKRTQPSIIIHMAAQPLVRSSYEMPVETFATNVIGTVNLFEAARETKSVEAIINVTTDKCYENQEWIWPYRENDKLGGHDPYSGSKACSELVTNTYRNSYFAKNDVRIASVRAGNVIGGGDWSKDRLIPDIFRAHEAKKTLNIRYPNAVRPWQHVLDPISGYLRLAEKLVSSNNFSASWNFGPRENNEKKVSWILDYFSKKFNNIEWKTEIDPSLHETGLLRLDSSKAKLKLGWTSKWSLETALNKTIDWYQAWQKNKPMIEFSIKQIKSYEKELKV